MNPVGPALRMQRQSHWSPRDTNLAPCHRRQHYLGSAHIGCTKDTRIEPSNTSRSHENCKTSYLPAGTRGQQRQATEGRRRAGSELTGSEARVLFAARIGGCQIREERGGCHVPGIAVPLGDDWTGGQCHVILHVIILLQRFLGALERRDRSGRLWLPFGSWLAAMRRSSSVCCPILDGRLGGSAWWVPSCVAVEPGHWSGRCSAPSVHCICASRSAGGRWPATHLAHDGGRLGVLSPVAAIVMAAGSLPLLFNSRDFVPKAEQHDARNCQGQLIDNASDGNRETQCVLE